MAVAAAVSSVTAYAESVISGERPACKLVIQSCQRHLRDLANGHERGLRFDDATAAKAIGFFSFLKQSKGEWAGQGLILLPWQAFIVGSVFGWKRADGFRRFRTVYIETPRKQGKSTMSAGVGLYLLMADGEPGAEIYCLDESTRILHSDLTWQPIGNVKVGDELIGFDENPPNGSAFYRKAHPSRVEKIWRSTAEAYRIVFANGHNVICSANHRWLSKSANGSNLHWRQTSQLRPGMNLRFLGLPWDKCEDRDAGYLSGIFDGEGYFHSPLAKRSSFRVGMAQKPGAVLDETIRILRKMGFNPTEPRPMGKSSASTIEVGGLYEVLRLLGQLHPVRLFPRHSEIWNGRALNRNGSHLAIERIEPVGIRNLVDIQTTTGTFFAEGFFSHNSAATHRDQARIVHEEAVAMVKASEALRSRIVIFRDNLHIDATRSKYEPLGADADTMDGLNIHGVIVDELHAHKTRAMWNVLDTATGARRQPLIWAVTTAGWDRHSICWEQHQYSEQLLSTVIDDDTYFCYLAGADPGDDWRSPSTWIKANPSIGVSVKMDDLVRKAAKAAAVPSEQNAFKRLHLDIWTEQAERWLDLSVWDACAGPIDRASLKGRTCYAGLDLSSTLDLSALALLFPMGDGTVQVLVHFWLPAENMRHRVDRDRVPYDVWAEQGYITLTPGNVIDYEFIREEAKRLATQYQIERFGYDPYNATQLVLQLADDGLEMVPVRQGFLSLNAPTKDLETRIVSRKIVHDGNPVLRWMISNVAIERDAADNIKPAKDKSTEKIDGVLSMIMALDQLSRGGGDDVSPYETSRLLIL